MLKIMGNRVYPGEVAAQLLALPGVLQAEVVGVNGDDSVTRLFAFVVLDPDAPAPVDVRRQMASRLPAYMVPAAVFTKDAIPRTASGKPDYPALVAEAVSGMNVATRQTP
jgi:acyl-CoA synthetase (AMP-forming)/AMP-acid ligase II